MADIMPPRGYLSVLEGTYPASNRTLWRSVGKNNSQSTSQRRQASVLNNQKFYKHNW